MYATVQQQNGIGDAMQKNGYGKSATPSLIIFIQIDPLQSITLYGERDSCCMESPINCGMIIIRRRSSHKVRHY